MDNDNDHISNKPLGSEDKKNNEKIPLWLQGLQEHENEDTSPIQVAESGDNGWIEESTEKPQDNLELISETPGKASETENGSSKNPDWLIELSEIHSGSQHGSGKEIEDPTFSEEHIEKNSTADGKEAEKYDISNRGQDGLEKESADLVETNDNLPHTNTDNEPTVPSEIDITETVQDQNDETNSQDDELPPWLHEMIAEPQESAPEQSPVNEKANDYDQIDRTQDQTKPMDLDDELSTASIPDAEGKEIIMAEEIQTEYEDSQHEFENESGKEPETIEAVNIENEEAAESHPESAPSEWIPADINANGNAFKDAYPPFETPNTTMEGDTHPIDVTEETSASEAPIDDKEEDMINEAEESLPLQTEQEVQPFEAEPLIESMPEDVEYIKTLLANGETDEAIQHIKDIGINGQFNQELQTWLMNASYITNPTGIEFWETLGDVALENEDHDTAINAYTKAIQSLLINEQDQNEFS